MFRKFIVNQVNYTLKVLVRFLQIYLKKVCDNNINKFPFLLSLSTFKMKIFLYFEIFQHLSFK